MMAQVRAGYLKNEITFTAAIGNIALARLSIGGGRKVICASSAAKPMPPLPAGWQAAPLSTDRLCLCDAATTDSACRHSLRHRGQAVWSTGEGQVDW